MTNVLYDEPGPKARRRAAIGTVVAAVLLLGLTGVAVWRLADRGQFDAELWSPLINPSDDNFVLVWRLLAKGLQATLTAAVLAISLSLVIGTLLGVARMMLGKGGRIPVITVIELFRGLPVIISFSGTSSSMYASDCQSSKV